MEKYNSIIISDNKKLKNNEDKSKNKIQACKII